MDCKAGGLPRDVAAENRTGLCLMVIDSTLKKCPFISWALTMLRGRVGRATSSHPQAGQAWLGYTASWRGCQHQPTEFTPGTQPFSAKHNTK
jgi:hypothetical protein